MPELELCKCGEAPVSVVDTENNVWWVGCIFCGHEGPHKKTDIEADLAWNRMRNEPCACDKREKE
jgi:hypothetical protein